MKIDTTPYGILLIAETDNDKELLNIFHRKGVRVTAYDTVKHRMMIETKLERPAFIEIVSKK